MTLAAQPHGMTECDRCGDVSNSPAGLMCGRVEFEEDTGLPITRPCTGTYQAVIE